MHHNLPPHSSASAINLPQRTIALSGASNFRDLGGYTGHGGRALKWRHLFRADHLAALTPQDLARLGELGITRSADFRGASERAAQAYALPGVATHTLDIEPVLIQQALQLQGSSLSTAQAVRLMHDTYRSFVTENAPRFAQLFELLLDSDAPLVFHCTAGKDRTGFAAALILLALGVPRAVVMQDYLLTNQLYRRDARLEGKGHPHVMQVLWQVQPEFLHAAFEVIDAQHGGMQDYLHGAIGLTPQEVAELRRMLVSLNERIRFIRWIDMESVGRSSTQQEHLDILRAISARDSAASERLMAAHIGLRREQVVDAITRGLARIYLPQEPAAPR